MDADYGKRLGGKLRELRETYGHTQADIAAAAEIRQPTYSNYENGKRIPSSAVLYRIASYYGMLADELISYCVDLDEDIFFEKLETKDETREKAEYMAFSKLKRYSVLTPMERDMLFYFSKLNKEVQDEVIAFAKFKFSIAGQARLHG